MVALLSTLAPREFTDMWSIRPKGQALCIIRVSDRYSETGWKPGLLHLPWWSIHEVRKCLNRSRPEFECPRTLPGVRNPQSRSSFRLLPPSLVPKRPLPSWIPDRTMDLEATPFMKNKVQNAIFSNRVYKASGHYPTAVHLDEDLQALFVRGSTFYAVLKLGGNFACPFTSSTTRLWHSWIKVELGSRCHTAETTRSLSPYTCCGHRASTKTMYAWFCCILAYLGWAEYRELFHFGQHCQDGT